MVTRTLPRAAAPTLTALIALVLALAGAVLASAQTRPLKAGEAFRLTPARAADGTLSLSWRIAPGTYLYRESLKARMDGAVVSLSTAAGKEKDDPNFGLVEIYHGHAEARAAGLPAQGAIEVSFQGCAEAGICYPAITRRVDLATLAVTAPAVAVPGAGVPLDSSAAEGGAASQPAASPPASAKPASAGAVKAIPGGGLGAPLAAFFGFGLLLAFTPCVFPMLPILSGILAGRGARPSPLRGFALSGAYGLAMAAAYGVLGLVAAWSGANLQAALQTPWALGLMATVFAALAASMLGLFEITVPAALAARLQRGAGGSIAGAAALGFGAAR